MGVVRPFKVVWKDGGGIVHERVFAINVEDADQDALDEAGRQIAENSQYGFNTLIWIVPCHPNGVSDFSGR